MQSLSKYLRSYNDILNPVNHKGPPLVYAHISRNGIMRSHIEAPQVLGVSPRNNANYGEPKLEYRTQPIQNPSGDHTVTTKCVFN